MCNRELSISYWLSTGEWYVPQEMPLAETIKLGRVDSEEASHVSHATRFVRLHEICL